MPPAPQLSNIDLTWKEKLDPDISVSSKDPEVAVEDNILQIKSLDVQTESRCIEKLFISSSRIKIFNVGDSQEKDTKSEKFIPEVGDSVLTYQLNFQYHNVGWIGILEANRDKT